MWALTACVATIFVAAGCASAHFACTDPAYVSAPSTSPPAMFFQFPPARPYRTVGIIVVVLEEGAREKDLVAALQREAQRVGCELVVYKDAAGRAELGGARPILVAHEGHTPVAREPTTMDRPAQGGGAGGSGGGGEAAGGRGGAGGLQGGGPGTMGDGNEHVRREFLCGIYLDSTASEARGGAARATVTSANPDSPR